MFRSLFALCAPALVLAAACQGDDRPLPVSPTEDAAGSGGFGWDSGTCPGPDGGFDGLSCGETVVAIPLERKNLYFVLDRSGSMGEPLEGSAFDKYTSARVAVSGVLASIGTVVHYGGAVFPGFGSDGIGCSVGREVFETRSGADSATSCDAGDDTLLAFQRALSEYGTAAGTPVATTLAALLPTLSALPGRTVVVLATDGAPNCNPDASCGAEDCILNIEAVSVSGKRCDASFNCCDPSNVVNGQYSCIDRTGTLAAVSALAEASVQTYVVGMPGSETYSALLDELAVAGGTARNEAPRYYAVRDVTELTDTLRQIGDTVATSCLLELAEAPPDPSLVNVFLDAELITANTSDGWAWTGERSLELRGAACARLEAGTVRQVRVVAGCPTTVE